MIINRIAKIFGFALLFGTLLQTNAYSLPELAILYGSEMYEGHTHDEVRTMDCSACHVNPTGGGMRNEHGRKFSIEKLPMMGPPKDYESISEGAQINRFLSFGTDLRFAYIRTEGASSFQDTFFQMQTDIYVAFTPIEHLTIFYMDGLQQNREVYGLISGLPQNAHVKIGLFVPPYGLKLDDHTAFIRDKLGLGNTDGKASNSGVEAGFANELFFGNLALFNGSGPAPDENRDKAISGTGGLKSSRFWLAGSVYHNKTGKDDATAVTNDYAGVYTALHLWKIGILGELDRISVKNPATTAIGYVLYSELFATLTRGVIGKIKYEEYDPNHDARGDRQRRFTAGFNFYPYPFTEVIVEYRKNTEEVEVRNNQFLAMAHLFF